MMEAFQKYGITMDFMFVEIPYEELLSHESSLL